MGDTVTRPASDQIHAVITLDILLKTQQSNLNTTTMMSLFVDLVNLYLFNWFSNWLWVQFVFVYIGTRFFLL